MNKFVRKMLNSRVPYLLLPLLSCVPADANILNTSSAPATSVQSTAENTYVAGNNSVQQLFFVIGGVLHKPFIVSVEAAKKRVSGNFDLNDPKSVLDTVAARTGLIWYDDGSSVYIYDSSEIQSSVVRLAFAPFDRLVAYLQSSGLYDPRFPLRSDGRSGSFYVSGPPVYVELVSAAAKYIDATYARPGTGETTIRVIKLKNSFVNDRNYTQRDVPVTVPGVATVLNQLLNNTSSREGGRSAPAGRILPLITIRAARWKRPLRRKR
jgi:type III secretion protein C